MTEKARELVTRVNGKIEELAALVSDAARSEAMQDFMIHVARFHRYSLNNVLLIQIQNPSASRVAGYQDWKKKFKRQVMKGEKGIKILAPCTYKLDPDDDDSPTEVRGFRVVTVFDVAQTEGEPLPDPPTWESKERLEELDQKLRSFAEANDITIIEKDLIDGTYGLSHGGKIELDPSAGTSTLIHELAHELLHKKKKLSKETKELEAEAIAFIVGSHCGLTDLGSPNYLALWNIDPEAIAARADRIREAAIQIIGGIS